MDTASLLGIIGAIIIAMLTLLISLVWDIKKDQRSMKTCIDAKQDKYECNRLMDKHEDWIKEVRK